MDTSKLNLYVTSFAFFFLYAAYMTTINFATTNHPIFGPIALGLSFFTWIVSLFSISSPMVNWIGPKYAMFIGALTYPLYVVSGINLSSTLFIALYLAASALVGIGAGLLWVGQSSFIIECANQFETQRGLSLNSKLGQFNGTFMIFFNQARFVGSLIAALMFQFNGSVHSVFMAMMIICIAGSFTFLFIRQPSKSDTNDTEIDIEQATKNEDIENDTTNSSKCSDFVDEMKSIICLWRDRRHLSIFPVTFASGLFISFVSGELSALIEDNAFKFYVLTVEAFVASISCILFGKASDKWGALYFLVICCTLFCGVFILFFFWEIDQNAIYMWFGIAAILGIADGGLFTLTPQIHPMILGDKKAVFANLKMIQAIASCLGFAYYPFTTFQVRLSTNLFTMVLAIFFLLYSDQVRDVLIIKNKEKRPSRSQFERVSDKSESDLFGEE